MKRPLLSTFGDINDCQVLSLSFDPAVFEVRYLYLSKRALYNLYPKPYPFNESGIPSSGKCD